jgi:hypothetical protein
MRIASSVVLAGLLGGIVTAPLAAQREGVELGADVGLGLSFGGGSTIFTASTPTSLRFGVPVGSTMSFEPRVNFVFVSGEGDTFTNLSLTPALLFGFGGEARNGPYAAVLPSLSLASGFGETSTQFGAGAGVGVRRMSSDQFGLRFEVQFVHFFENDDFADFNDLRALIGFSYFTR